MMSGELKHYSKWFKVDDNSYPTLRKAILGNKWSKEIIGSSTSDAIKKRLEKALKKNDTGMLIIPSLNELEDLWRLFSALQFYYIISRSSSSDFSLLLCSPTHFAK